METITAKLPQLPLDYESLYVRVGVASRVGHIGGCVPACYIPKRLDGGLGEWGTAMWRCPHAELVLATTAPPRHEHVLQCNGHQRVLLNCFTRPQSHQGIGAQSMMMRRGLSLRSGHPARRLPSTNVLRCNIH